MTVKCEYTLHPVPCALWWLFRLNTAVLRAWWRGEGKSMS